MRKRREEIVPQNEEKVLDVTASMQGSLRFDDPVNLRINGKFDGTLDTKGKLHIGKDAKIRANVNGEVVTIAGYVEGNICATSILRLEGSAKLFGDIETPRLAVEEGAIVNGQIRMENGTASSPKSNFMTLSQVADYLEVDITKINEWANNGMLPGDKHSGEWIFDRLKLDQWVSQGKIKV